MEYYAEKLKQVNQQIELAKIGFMVKFDQLPIADNHKEFYENFKQINNYIKSIEKLEEDKEYYTRLTKEN